MKSWLTDWFLNLKLEVTLTEALRLKKRILDLRNHGLEICPNLALTLPTHYLTALKCLLIQSNFITEFCRINCYFLKNLKGLAVDYNKLEYLPFDFRHLKNLTVLNVSHNRFENHRFLFVICQLKSLRILWANATNIDEIPREIGELSKLRILGLRRNRIKIIAKELFSLENLRWLTLADNQISEIDPGISNLASLVHLNLQRNYLQKLPPNFNAIPELQYLYLDHNLFLIDEQFKSFITSLPNLKYCCVSHNLGVGTSTDGSANSDEVPASLSPDFLEPLGSQASRSNSIRRSRYSNDNNPPMDSRLQGHPAMSHVSSGDNNETEWGNLRLSMNQMEFHIESDENIGAQISEISTDSGEITIVPAEENNFGDDNDENLSIDMNFDLYVKSSEDEWNHEDDWGLERDVDVNMNCEIENTSEIDETHPFLVPSSSLPEGDGRSFSGQSENREIPTCKNDKNGNIGINSQRQSRTEEWIHKLSSSTGFELENISRKGSSISVESSSRSNAESRLNIMRRVKTHVDGFIDEAAHQAGESKKTNITTSGLASPVPSSATLVYIMPHGRKPQPYCANASASFTCNRTVSSSVFVTPSDDETLGNVNSQFHLPLHATTSSVSTLYQQNAGERDDENEAESTLFSLSSSRANVSSSLRVVQSPVVDDEESNYDPSDWDHSAPSSAIDDQDVVTRFADFRDDDSENNGEIDELLQLNDWDWRRLILPLALLR